MPNPGNPQSFNRYSYVYNNPIRLADPSGHCASRLDCLEGGDALEGGSDYGNFESVEETLNKVDNVADGNGITGSWVSTRKIANGEEIIEEEIVLDVFVGTGIDPVLQLWAEQESERRASVNIEATSFFGKWLEMGEVSPYADLSAMQAAGLPNSSRGLKGDANIYDVYTASGFLGGRYPDSPNTTVDNHPEVERGAKLVVDLVATKVENFFIAGFKSIERALDTYRLGKGIYNNAINDN